MLIICLGWCLIRRFRSWNACSSQGCRASTSLARGGRPLWVTTGPTQVPGVAAMGRHSALERRRRTVALASNATDRLSDDLRRLRVDREFDAVFNSSTMGLAKPDQRVFIHIADALGGCPGRR
jgi:hypothetical protein